MHTSAQKAAHSDTRDADCKNTNKNLKKENQNKFLLWKGTLLIIDYTEDTKAGAGWV